MAKCFPAIFVHRNLTARHRFSIGLIAMCWCLACDSSGQNASAQGIRYSRDDDDRVVAVTYCGETGLRSAGLDKFPHLQRVEVVYGTKLTSDDMDVLSSLESVTDLSIGGNLSSEYVTVEGSLSSLANLENLQTLFLCKHDVTDDDLEFIAALPRIEYVELVADTNRWDEVEGPGLTDRCADHLSRATTLRDICVYSGEELTDRFVAKLSQHLNHLEHLDLASNNLTDESLKMLASRCKELKWLDVRSDRFTDQGVKQLARARNLEMLWLRSERLTHACVASVAGLKRLRHLELTVPTIGDDGVRVLANLRRLEILALRQPALTDEQFAMFQGNPTIQSAFINGVGLSTERTLRIIREMPALDHLSVGAKNRDLQEAINHLFASRPIKR